MTAAPFILGSRGSALALVQAEMARSALLAAYPGLEVEIRTYTTSGDQKVDLSLIRESPAGAKGLFTRELEEALLRGEIHAAVHSCKDMPWEMAEGLLLGGVLERANPEDILITRSPGGLAALPSGAQVGTSSVRRARQLLWKRPDLRVAEIRGNVQTRLRKLRESAVLEGTILARAGLERLGFDPLSGSLESAEAGRFHCELLDFYPAIGQGAIALQIRQDQVVFQAVRAISHEPTWLAIRAERELLRLLEGDCRMPVGVRTRLIPGVDYVGELLEMSVLLFPSDDAAPPRIAECRGPAEAPEAVAAGVCDLLKR